MILSLEKFLGSGLSSHLLDPFLLAIKRSRKRLDATELDPGAFSALNRNRILVSQSLLQSDQDRKNWDQANAYVAQVLQEEGPSPLAILKSINARLTAHSGELRNVPVYAGDFEFSHPASFPALLGILEGFLLHEDVLLRASLAYIWTINVHPFLDGNGRTARLFADYLLLKDGYLPLCFPSHVSGHVVHGYADRDLSLSEAAMKCLKAIQHSYQLVLPSLN
jgi:fido (protein-threonine AMPylation protein)